MSILSRLRTADAIAVGEPGGSGEDVNRGGAAYRHLGRAYTAGRLMQSPCLQTGTIPTGRRTCNGDATTPFAGRDTARGPTAKKIWIERRSQKDLVESLGLNRLTWLDLLGFESRRLQSIKRKGQNWSRVETGRDPRSPADAIAGRHALVRAQGKEVDSDRDRRSGLTVARPRLGNWVDSAETAARGRDRGDEKS